MREQAKVRLTELINRYRAEMTEANRNEVSEETVRAWLNAFLDIFGWSVQNTSQVLQERVLGGEQRARLYEINSPHRRPDYTLRNGANIKTFLDAKSLDVDIFTDRSAAYQIRSYGWSAQTPCAFISNFEQFVIFDTRFIPVAGQDANIGTIQLTIDQYIDSFDVLYNHLWREDVWNNKLFEIYQATAIEGRNRLDSSFMHFLSEFRIALARNIISHNGDMFNNDIALNYYVQVILDRIIFIRVCESKEIEPQERLKNFINSPQGFWDSFKSSCYMEFYRHYDGAMFERDERFQNMQLDNAVFIDFISKLYYPYPYKFDVIPVKVFAKIYEEFLGKQIVSRNGQIEEMIKPEYVQVNGAISTPEHIVEMICKKTLSITNTRSVEELLNIKILDPCCGSGVFLICCYEILFSELKHILNTNPTDAEAYVSFFFRYNNEIHITLNGRRAIASACLHGIDCDEAAIEVAKMSLALKIVDCEVPALLNPTGAFGELILRDVTRNLKLGNTLVDTDIELDEEDLLKIKPLSIHNVYTDVFERHGGFDFIVGNPPYVETKHFKFELPEMHRYISAKYSAFEGKADLAVIFIERCLGLLRDIGKLGFIVQRRWYKTDYGQAVRNIIDVGMHKCCQLDFLATNIFERHITYVSLLVLSKAQSEQFEYSYITEHASTIKTQFENSNSLGEYVGYVARLIPNTGMRNEVWAYESYEAKLLRDELARRLGTLSEYPGLHVKDGIQALWKRIYHITNVRFENGIAIGRNGFNEEVSVENAMLRAVIYNKVFYPFKDVEPNAYCIFPYRGNSTERITITQIHNEFPLLFAYLTANQERIQNNVRFNSGTEYWHTFTREHNHSSYNLDKIIIPMTAKDTIATYVSGHGLYMDNANVWFITVDGASAILMKAITCVINSTVFSVLAKVGANPQSGGYYKFNRQFLDPVAFPNASVTDDQQDIIRLSQLYDEITGLQNTWIRSVPTRREMLDGVIENRWQEVDLLSERLYVLSPEESELINGIGRTVSRTDLLSGAN